MRKFFKLKNLTRPEQGLQALVEHAPQAEAFAEEQIERMRPVLTWFYGARRRLATGAVLFITVWLFLHVMFGANGMVVYRQKRGEYQGLQKEIDGLQKENDRYTSQIKALRSDPRMIEKEAREQLHYARPGEVVYVSPAQPTPQPQDTKSAQK